MKRILFVDDEPNILEGLQRMLRPQRAHWQMSFANGGEQALAMLEASPVDVIVTDMRMPIMDGAMLLERVRERFPSIIRIVLSGHFDIEAGLRAVPVAHQFLVKPCDAGKLRAAVERACGLNALLADEPTRRVVSAVGELPSLPRTCAAVMTALEDPDVSLSEVGSMIAGDVAISAKVLQLVNSAFFGLSQEIADVRVGVSYLGIDLLKQLILSVAILRAFRPSRAIRGFSLETFDEHSRLSAEIARQLPVPKNISSLCIVASLLHDVGQLVLALRMAEPFEAALAASSSRQCPLHIVEREILGTTHAEVGAYLLGLWGLPMPIVAGVAQHHHWTLESASGTTLDLHSAIHVADVLSYERMEKRPGDPLLTENGADAMLLEHYGLTDRVQELRKTWANT